MTDQGDRLLDPNAGGSLLPRESSSTAYLPIPGQEHWKALIVDDEQEVHNLTRLVLGDYSFREKNLEFISAKNGAEAKELIRAHPDTAFILLDVVMETDDAGLEVARYIRDELKNKFVRIILRTGQPGHAPEQKVIREYDINDYKEKTELTSQKLSTCVTTALRSYQDLVTIEQNRKGLETVINSSKSLFELQSLEQFATGLLKQLTSILRIDHNAILPRPSSLSATRRAGKFIVLAGTGQYENHVGQAVDKVLDKDTSERVLGFTKKNDILFTDNSLTGYFETHGGTESLMYLTGQQTLTTLDQDLIRIFANNMAIAFENVMLNKEVADTQQEVILTLGEVVENRSKESANHVKRVAEQIYLLAKKIGIPEEEAQMLRLASPMHDVGKIGIPDTVLNKPGRLTREEYAVMQKHSNIGLEILKNSNRPLMKAASIVAYQHHERWNGKGYPDGLAGNDIHIYGRISAVADVFDALICRRVYKEPWPEERIYQLFKEERGKHFDPELVDLFLRCFDEFVAIHHANPDQ